MSASEQIRKVEEIKRKINDSDNDIHIQWQQFSCWRIQIALKHLRISKTVCWGDSSLRRKIFKLLRRRFGDVFQYASIESDQLFVNDPKQFFVLLSLSQSLATSDRFRWTTWKPLHFGESEKIIFFHYFQHKIGSNL